METTKEPGLLDQIVPPRLEDAGLEECAIPPDSIMEAFYKAATAVKSHTASIFSGEDNADAECVKDPWPTAKDASDVVIGMEPGNEPSGACTVEKGGGIGGMGGDDVKVGRGGVEADDMGDEVVVGDGGVKLGQEGKACVDELQGLKIKEDMKKSGGDEEEKREDERPSLVEGFV